MPSPGPEPMRGSATAASSTNGSAGKTVSGQAHCSHRHPTHSAVTFTLLRCSARLRHRQCLTARHCRRVRGRIRLAALVSGIVVPPQPDPDVTQARCSSQGCPATPSLTLTHSLTALCLRSIAFTAQPSALAALGGIVAVRLGHTLAAVAVLRSLASALPLIDIARGQNPASRGLKARFCRKIFDKWSNIEKQ